MAGHAERITGKNFDAPDERRQPFEKDRIDVITVGGLTFYREILEPSWQWSKHVKPVVGGESCQKFHVKIFLAGRRRVRMEDGTEMEFGPGDVAVLHPGTTRGWSERPECADRARRRRQAKTVTGGSHRTQRTGVLRRQHP